MASRPHLPDADEEHDSTWQECRPGNGWRFTGNLGDVDGSLTISRRPLMDTYCQYMRREMLDTDELAGLRSEAETAACTSYMQKGYNYVHHEEFEFAVDVYVWKAVFFRDCEDTGPLWPWPVPVQYLQDGGVSVTYDRWLSGNRQPSTYISASTQTVGDMSIPKSYVQRDERLRQRLRFRRYNRATTEAQPDISGRDTDPLHRSTVGSTASLARIRQLEERLVKMSARLAKLEESSDESSSSDLTDLSDCEDRGRTKEEPGSPPYW